VAYTPQYHLLFRLLFPLAWRPQTPGWSLSFSVDTLGGLSFQPPFFLVSLPLNRYLLIGLSSASLGLCSAWILTWICSISSTLANNFAHSAFHLEHIFYMSTLCSNVCSMFTGRLQFNQSINQSINQVCTTSHTSCHVFTSVTTPEESNTIRDANVWHQMRCVCH
jgi:hypothetical protein